MLTNTAADILDCLTSTFCIIKKKKPITESTPTNKASWCKMSRSTPPTKPPPQAPASKPTSSTQQTPDHSKSSTETDVTRKNKLVLRKIPANITAVRILFLFFSIVWGVLVWLFWRLLNKQVVFSTQEQFNEAIAPLQSQIVWSQFRVGKIRLIKFLQQICWFFLYFCIFVFLNATICF